EDPGVSHPRIFRSLVRGGPHGGDPAEGTAARVGFGADGRYANVLRRRHAKDGRSEFMRSQAVDVDDGGLGESGKRREEKQPGQRAGREGPVHAASRMPTDMTAPVPDWFNNEE